MFPIILPQIPGPFLDGHDIGLAGENLFHQHALDFRIGVDTGVGERVEMVEKLLFLGLTSG